MRGQVTVFVILGLFAILVLGGLLFLKAMLQNIDAQSTGKNLFVQDQSLEAYIQTCTQQETEEVLNNLFLSGGHLSQAFGGSFPDSYFTTYNGTRYSYGIFRDSHPIYTVSSNFKPSGASGYEGLMSANVYGPTGVFNQPREWTSYTTNNFFGKVSLPKLCMSKGPNGFNATNTSLTCIQQLYDQGFIDETIQAQIASALTSRISRCFENLPPYYDISVDNPGGVTVMLTDDAIVVDLNRTIVDNVRKFDLTNLSYAFPYRVKRLYSAAYLLALFDVNNVTFDKISNSDELPRCTFADTTPCLDSRMIVTVHRSVIGKDDLVVIQDRASSLSYAGNEYGVLTMAFLVENRRPYLETIRNQPQYGAAAVSTGMYCGAIPATEQNLPMRYTIAVYDADEDAPEIYGTPGSITATKASGSDPQYYDGSDYVNVVSATNRNGAQLRNFFVFEPVPTGAGPFEMTECLSSYLHCHYRYDALTHDYLYDSTVYFFQVHISDGEFEDRQTFSIEVS